MSTKHYIKSLLVWSEFNCILYISDNLNYQDFENMYQLSTKKKLTVKLKLTVNLKLTITLTVTLKTENFKKGYLDVYYQGVHWI